MKNCKFCAPVYQKNRAILENNLFFANFDGNPVTEGHMKVIPKRHIDSFFDLSDEEINAAYALIKKAKDMLDKKFHPDAYNIGLNNGKAAGQTVFHLHIHIIPRYFGDVPDPTGGVRNVIPDKGNYLKNQFFDCARGMNHGLVQGGELRHSPLAIPHCFVHAASRVE